MSQASWLVEKVSYAINDELEFQLCRNENDERNGSNWGNMEGKSCDN